jgi:hypothetical protein
MRGIVIGRKPCRSRAWIEVPARSRGVPCMNNIIARDQIVRIWIMGIAEGVRICCEHGMLRSADELAPHQPKR